jgi:small ligand-binding sensory domain FIST
LRTAAALSEHPLATHALGECVGHLLDTGGTGPDVLVVLSTGPHTGVLEDIVAAARHLLDPGVVVGCTAAGVLGGSREVGAHTGLVMFAVWAGQPERAIMPVRLTDGVPMSLRGAVGTLVLFADPFSVDAEALVDELAVASPDLTVMGAQASAASHRGGNRLLLDADQHDRGAVGVLFDPGVALSAVVAQGCRPVGAPMTVTDADGPIVRQLAGRPALERLHELVEQLDEVEREAVAEGLHVGRLLREGGDEPDPADVLVRAVRGADRAIGALAVDDEVPVGSTLQFHLRDAQALGQDLSDLLARRRATGALVASSTGRVRPWSVPDRDAVAIADALGSPPVAGMASAGEFGPVGGRTFVHAVSTSVLLFG